MRGEKYTLAHTHTEISEMYICKQGRSVIDSDESIQLMVSLDHDTSKTYIRMYPTRNDAPVTCMFQHILYIFG